MENKNDINYDSYLKGSQKPTSKDCEFFGIPREELAKNTKLTVTIVDHNGSEQTHTFDISDGKSYEMKAS